MDWIKKWTKEQDSLLWDMPPSYYKMWNFLLYNCAEGKYTGSLNDITKGISWTENGKKRPTRATVQTMLKWFVNQKMVESDIDERIRTLKIKNWSKYQGGKGKAPKVPEKTKSKGPDPTISFILNYYKKNIYSDGADGKVRYYIHAKNRKWGKDTIIEALDEFKLRCKSNSSYEERMRYKGPEFWFRYTCDEMVALSKRRKDTSYVAIPRISRGQKSTA